jgi:hypothetical protein
MAVKPKSGKRVLRAISLNQIQKRQLPKGLSLLLELHHSSSSLLLKEMQKPVQLLPRRHPRHPSRKQALSPSLVSPLVSNEGILTLHRRSHAHLPLQVFRPGLGVVALQLDGLLDLEPGQRPNGAQVLP